MSIAQTTAYLGQMFEGVYLVDNDRTILYWNQAAEELTGYKASEVVNKNCYDNILMHVDDNGNSLCRTVCPLQKTIQDGMVHNVSVYLRHKKGHRVPVNVRSVPLKDDAGMINCTMEVFTRTGQVTNADQLKELARKAFIDSLTGLPNKDYAENKFKSLLASEVPGDISQWGILFIEIDNLREISTTYGMSTANDAVRIAAKTLLENLQPGELAARWDAGLFLLITGLDKKSVLLNWASKTKALIERSQVPGYDTLSLKVCVGGLVATVRERYETLILDLENELKTSRSTNNNLSIHDS